ncbi:glycosyltransferase [Candidatus Saccharibacteria bacterium]|nr:glycosyltransferase [Candidatus Saccharibacteria bacterium]
MFKYINKLRIKGGKIKAHIFALARKSRARLEELRTKITLPKDPVLTKALALKNAGRLADAFLTLNNSLEELPLGTVINQEDLVRWLAISNESAEISIRSRIKKPELYKQAILKYVSESKHVKHNRSKKIAIFTAISGGYDSVKLPATLDSRFDYIIFSDKPVDNPGFYDVRPLPYIDFDNTRSARYVKTNPHKLLPEYDIAVWIDANIMILGDIYPYVEKVLTANVALGGLRHPLRKSVYDEADECLKASKGDPASINSQVDFYRKQGYESETLLETNFLVYDLRKPELQLFLDEWWKQIDTFSNRDQLSVGYALDTHEIKWVPLMPHPNTTRNNKALSLTRHGQDISNLLAELSSRVGAKQQDPNAVKAAKLKKKSAASIDIVYCVHNALDDVKTCLESVEKHLEPHTQLIIVNDGSDSETTQFLRRFTHKNAKWVNLKTNKKATGYTSAASQGIKMSSADFVILLNSDTVVTKNWTRKMARCAYSSNDIGIVGPLSSAASHQSIPTHKNSDNQTATNALPKGITAEKLNNLCEKNAGPQPYIRVPLVHGFCFGIKRTVIDSIGYFDKERFPRGYGEENDYCFRASDAGFGLAISLDTYVYHAKSKSFVGAERIALMKKGMEKNVLRYGQHRISRAIQTMDSHPRLEEIRLIAADLYNSVR